MTARAAVKQVDAVLIVPSEKFIECGTKHLSTLKILHDKAVLEVS